MLFAFDAITLVMITQNGWIGSVSQLNIASFLIVLLSSLGWAVCGWRYAHHFPPDPVLPLPHRMRYCLLFLSYVMCANIFSRSAVPTLLLVMVSPLEGISAIGLGCFVFLVLAVFILLLRSRTKKDCSFFAICCYFLLSSPVWWPCMSPYCSSVLEETSIFNPFFLRWELQLLGTG